MVYQELIGLLDLHTHKLLQTYLNIYYLQLKKQFIHNYYYIILYII